MKPKYFIKNSRSLSWCNSKSWPWRDGFYFYRTSFWIRSWIGRKTKSWDCGHYMDHSWNNSYSKALSWIKKFYNGSWR